MIVGSALRKLEAITGLKASKTSDSCYRLDISDGVAFFSFLKDEKEACRALEQDNWRRVSRLVFESQEWKCGTCGSITGLSCHHKKFRSQWRRSDGPRDVPSNLTGLCQACHSSEHGIA